ncbi:flavin reductase [Arthrobacter sp. Marseille-P9274]|uniref:flavin reductase n=1 Tax=Arthrobacter sp. Marseille-P9274 TaxID=2866572 RepID=UPI0021C59B90|nr:flavin reductase [Arthrobacter sp. Marseille-P9274]
MTASAAPSLEYVASEPLKDIRAFRSALGQYGTGVAVITAMCDGRPVGMTVNSFAAVSLDPPLILWSVQNASGRAAAFTAAAHFAVNVLAAEQVDISRVVASPMAGIDPFDGIAWTEGMEGAPLIDEAIARFECRTHNVLPGGDHQIILGRVERCTVTEGEPLLFVQGAYATSQSFPASTAAHGPAAASAGASDSDQAQFAQLVTTVNHRLQRNFDEHRSRFGLTVASSRVLKRLSAGPQMVQELVESAFLGPQAIEDALSQLSERGLVETDGPVYCQTQAGRALREEVAEDARRFNEATLAGLPESDVAAAHRVLMALAHD